MIKYLYLLPGLFFLFVTQGWSQCVPYAFDALDVNQVNARLYNGGGMFWDKAGNPRYAVPANGNAADARHSLYRSGLWIGGLDSAGQLHLAAQSYHQDGIDFFPGPVRAGNVGYECDTFIAFNNFPRQKTGILSHSSGKILLLFVGTHIVYDPQTATQVWKTHVVPKLEYEPVELPDGRVMLFGDSLSNFPNPSRMMLLTSSGFNSTLGPSLQFFHRFSRALVLSGGKVFISGFQGHEMLDPTTMISTKLATSASNRHSHAVVELQDGRIFVSGGVPNSLLQGIGSVETELYDPVSNTWSAGPNMQFRRALHDMVLLPSGKVLIFGGSGPGAGYEVEVYDPVSNTLSGVARLEYPAGRPTTAIPLSNGEILVTYRDQVRDVPVSLCYNPQVNTFSQIRLNNLGPFAVPQSDGNIFMQWRDDTSFIEFDPLNKSLVGQRWQNIWKVSRQQIDAFRSDYANQAIDWSQYPVIRDWPAHGDTLKGEDFHLAPFVDVNLDGLYQPGLAGDYPCILGDQAIWWVFNDLAAPHSESRGTPLGVQIEAMAYAYDCQQSNCPDSSLDYTTFYHFEAVNQSANQYRDLYFGFLTESEIGEYRDDYVGCDTLLDLAYSYNGDADDQGPMGYGVHPPAIGTITLNTPDSLGMTNFIYYETENTPVGYPIQPSQYYGYLRSFWRDGNHLVNNGFFGYPGATPGPDINYMYPGDPGCGSMGQGSGWTEVSAGTNGNLPFDRRYLTSSGPFTFNPGDTLRYDYAIVWSRDMDSTRVASGNIASLCKLRQDVSAVRNFWAAQSKSCFNLRVGVASPETGAGFDIQVFPNPNAGSFSLQGPQDKTGQYELYDLLGRYLTGGDFQGEKRFAGLDRGVYLLRVSYGSQRLTRQIIVQ